MHTAVIVIEKLERKIELLKRDVSCCEVEDKDDECCKAKNLKLATLEPKHTAYSAKRDCKRRICKNTSVP